MEEYYAHLKPIVDEAYSLYMPQVKSEITEFYQFLNQHYGMSKKSELYNVLEIGTKFGGTFFLWCEMNRSAGLNISIDMDDGGKHGGIDSEKMDTRDRWFQERFGNCKFIRGNSHYGDILFEVRDILFENLQIPKKRFRDVSVNFLFIDGDHTYEGVKKDWKMYSPFVKSGGIIAFHDIKITDYHHGRDVYVGEFWEDLTKNRISLDRCLIDNQQYRILEFNNPNENWGGIGVLIKL